MRFFRSDRGRGLNLVPSQQPFSAQVLSSPAVEGTYFNSDGPFLPSAKVVFRITAEMKVTTQLSQAIQPSIQIPGVGDQATTTAGRPVCQLQSWRQDWVAGR